MATDLIARSLAGAKYAALPYVSGQYHMPDGVVRIAAGGASAAGTIRMIPGYIRSSVTITDLLVRISTLSASGNFQLAIYKADPVTNCPTGAPLYTSASQSTGTAGIVDIANVNLTVVPGLYWFAVQADTSGASVVFIAPDVSTVFFEQLVGSPNSTGILNSTNNCVFTKTGTFGTWPTLTGNQTTDSLSANTSSAGAAVAFKAA